MIDLQKLTQYVGDLDEKAVLAMLNEFVAGGPSEAEAQDVVAACQKGMTIVGDLFEKNEYYVGDLIFAGELLMSALDIIKPVLGQGVSAKIGSIVMGTVEGDLHDIGKNIFKGMSEAAGFEVYDLGIDVSPSAFVEKVKEVKPNILGMSGVLTLALSSMKKTVEAIEEAGLRDDIKIVIGGNPVNAEACQQIGADAFTVNAAEGIKICQGWV
ncbi:putative cobalamin binding protein [Desulfosporosinus orientis DSM 765]|uniref:Putative cobalamin binding protein n=1 Tax=Desulfosporosinus orientis (strain ATCC 19365 / DSM 765 / NCIMB 8382 / VKM B-1628 / Singapore I) TaxID=768706 RepID=G7WDI3_DESOD|nr:cobalamin-dependent protein [Desulfosporosinus orientis]AET67952.1 putative cobalamin binding protein [Desulfosporosinus orientis DSM 765]